MASLDKITIIFCDWRLWCTAVSTPQKNHCKTLMIPPNSRVLSVHWHFRVSDGRMPPNPSRWLSAQPKSGFVVNCLLIRARTHTQRETKKYPIVLIHTQTLQRSNCIGVYWRYGKLASCAIVWEHMQTELLSYSRFLFHTACISLHQKANKKIQIIIKKHVFFFWNSAHSTYCWELE